MVLLLYIRLRISKYFTPGGNTTMSVKNSAGVLKQLRGLMKTASCLS